MDWIAQWLWLIPALPVVAAGLSAAETAEAQASPRRWRLARWAFSLLLALAAFGHVLSRWSHGWPCARSSTSCWFQLGRRVRLGLGARSAGGGDAGDGHVCWAADLYLQTGYMAHDENFTRFFCFLSLVCRGDAGRGDRQQPAAAVYVLGVCRADFVSADWVLVSEACGGSGGEEGVYHDARRRSVFLLGWCGCIRRRARCSFTTMARVRWSPALAGLLAQHAAWG